MVLDEADKMLSLGLKPQLERLRALLLPPPAAEGAKPCAPGAGAPEPSARTRPQVQLWTATMPDELRAAAAPWLLRPRRVRASASAADQISRSVVQARQPACRPCLRARHMFALMCLECWQRPISRLVCVSGVDAGGAGQVVHVCAEHKKPAKLLKHLKQIQVRCSSPAGCVSCSRPLPSRSCLPSTLIQG